MLLGEPLAAGFRRIDLRLHGRADVFGVLRRRALLGQRFLLLACAFERGGDDRAFLRVGVLGRRARRCFGGRRLRCCLLYTSPSPRDFCR
ncbi:hypothetical protein KDW92_26330, partial [Burkholderia vietnamiensis]|nr:hypothetical protein [Burkholderia vietnamiensis]